MHRISRADLETQIAVILATAPDLVRQRLRSKLTSDRDWARHQLASRIAAQFDNDSTMVVKTDLVGLAPNQKPGKWGVDEQPPA